MNDSPIIDMSELFIEIDENQLNHSENKTESKSEESLNKKQDPLEYWNIKANRLGNTVEAVNVEIFFSL